MQALRQVAGTAIPLLLDNVDTDTIIRIDSLNAVPRQELGRYAFEALLRGPNGQPIDSPLHQPRFAAAPILLAGANFGCGSSREGAVWALQGRGIRCVIAASFGDIFFNNCFKNGVLPVALPRADVERLAKGTAGGEPLQVDLERQCIQLPGATAPIPFTVDPLQRELLLGGQDELEASLALLDAIDRWQQHDRHQRPWIWSAAPDRLPTQETP